MGTTLVREVFHRASSQLLDLSPQFLRWTQREMVDAANDGMRAIAKYIPSSSSRVDAIRLSAGSKQSIERIQAANILPGDGSTPADVSGTYFQSAIRNLGSTPSSAGLSIRVIDREILDTTTPNWHVPPGSWAGVQGVIFDPRFPKVFYIYPALPAATTWWIETSMLADPVLIPHQSAPDFYAIGQGATQTISIDDKYVDDLLNYILARAFMKDAEWAANPAMAQNYTALFTGSINAQVTALTGVNPNLQSLPFNPNVPARAAGRQ